MAKKRKKSISLLTLLLSVILVLSGCSSQEGSDSTDAKSAVAVDESMLHSDFQTELVEESTVEIVGYLGDGPVVEVPETVLGLTVVSIGGEAFAQPGIEEIILPDTVTTIKSYAFKDCSDLRAITFGNGLKHVENFVFQGCPKLEKVFFPESLLSLGYDLFGENEVLTEVYIPAGIVEMFGTIATASACPNLVVTITEGSLGHYSSESAGLTLNILPNTSLASVETADSDSPTSTNKALEDDDYVPEDAPDEKEDVLQKDSTDESMFEVQAIGANTCAVTGCTATDEYIVVPETIQGMTVIRIGSRAFENSDAVFISLPDSVTYIESHAFSKCKNLESVDLSMYLERVGELIFNECPALETIHFPNGMTEFEGTPIGRCAALQIVYVPDTVTEIPEGIAATSLCPDLVIVTPAGSAAEKVALEAGVPVSNEVSGG